MPIGKGDKRYSWGQWRVLRPTLGVALGLFVIAQGFFLPLANGLEFLPHLRALLKEKPWAKTWAPDWLEEKGETHERCKKANQLSQRWQELTGQPQRWSLFAPEVADEIWFLGVVINQTETNPLATETKQKPGYSFSLLSDNEPADPNHFFRLGRYRMRRFEMALEVHLYNYEDKSEEEKVQYWRDKIEKKVCEDWDMIEAYLQYRLRSFVLQHPDLAQPCELIMTIRHFEIPAPQKVPFHWDAPKEVPVARWQPTQAPSDEYLPIERYDPVAKRFERVSRLCRHP
jgi:hypothetical protein